MSEERDEDPKPHQSELNSQDLDAESAEDDSSVPVSQPSGLRHDRNTAEISGEMIDVVGEATGEFPRPSTGKQDGENTGRGAFMVGAGILVSRIIGVIRQRVFAHYFGNSLAADAFTAAF